MILSQEVSWLALLSLFSAQALGVIPSQFTEQPLCGGDFSTSDRPEQRVLRASHATCLK